MIVNDDVDVNWNKQDNVGWGVGLGVLAGVLGLALALFLLGIKRYRKEGPKGSPLTRLAQVFVAATRKWRVKATRGHHNYCYEEVQHHEPHHLHEPKIHTLLHTLQYRWVPPLLTTRTLHIFLSHNVLKILSLLAFFLFETT